MLPIRSFCLLSLFLVACSPGSVAEKQATSGLDALEQSLKEGDRVLFYFVGRTGTYDYAPEEFKEEASIRVERACGGDCHNFMRPVLNHLDAAFPAPCLQGQQTVLIEFGNKDRLMYHQRGRVIEHDGKCFYNEQPVERILESEGFFFR
ncbi:MAG: hypothetical protein RLO80_05110 [Hyphomonas sp.]